MKKIFSTNAFGKKGIIGSNEIIAIAIGLLMLAIILPIALNEMGGAVGATSDNENHMTYENWGGSQDVIATILVTVIPILAVLGIALKFM